MLGDGKPVGGPQKKGVNKMEEVTRQKSPRKLEDIARELGVRPKVIKLEEGKLTQVGENLFARRIGREAIEFFEVEE